MMMKKPWPGPDKIVLAFILILFSSAMVLARPHLEAVAHQQKACGLYEVFVGIIANNYGEQLVEARKSSKDGGRYEIWKSDETGTWTVIEIMPNRIDACILGTGTANPHTPDELMQRNAYEKQT